MLSPTHNGGLDPVYHSTFGTHILLSMLPTLMAIVSSSLDTTDFAQLEPPFA